MTSSDIDTKYKELEDCILELEIEYLQPYLNITSYSNKQMLDLKAFCVFCHASLENFAEELSLLLMNESIKQFVLNRKFSYSLLSLIHFYGKPTSAEDITDIHFDYINKQLNQIKSEYSKMVKDNHGVGLKYLRKLFLPLGIDIPADLKLRSSLQSLVEKRGEYAHKTALRATVVSDPNALIDLANDSCEIMKEFSNRVRRINFYSK